MLIAFVGAGPHQYGPPGVLRAGRLTGEGAHLFAPPNRAGSYPEPGRSTLT
jgi:hypothetical protein